MLKRYLGILLIAILTLSCFVSAFAEDASEEALLARKAELLAELTEINTQLGQAQKEKLLSSSEEALGKIKDLFPDEVVAIWVRDQIGKFSIEQPVTQEDLDKITEFRMFDTYGTPNDLTGIGYLRNLKRILIDNNNSSGFTGESFPDDFYTLSKLETVYAWECVGYKKSNILTISPAIENMTALQYFSINYANVTEIPDEICNLTNLETLGLGNTKITSLPENIGNLKKLTYLNIENTGVTALPDSIWQLNLETLKMAGTSIK